MAERGIALVGLYDSVLTDTEVCTIWAADLASHTALLRDGDPWPAAARDVVHPLARGAHDPGARLAPRPRRGPPT